jgi:hypothetical protein
VGARQSGEEEGDNGPAAAIVLLLVTLAGTVYPVPAWPYNILPYVFLALLAIGVGYFLALRRFAPDRLAQIEADLISSVGDSAA